jgi:hypothetical protein
MRQTQAQRFTDNLGRRCGTKELAPAARRSTGATTEVIDLVDRDLAVGKTRPDRLDLPRILA